MKPRHPAFPNAPFPERLIDQVPLIQAKTFSVCPQGHISEAPQHPCVQYREPDGSILQAIVCGRCQFDFFAHQFPAVILPKEKTRQEAEDIALGMLKATRRAEGLDEETGEPLKMVPNEVPS